MKTKSFLVALIVLVSTTVFASGPELRIAVVGQQQPGLFKVIYEGEKVADVKMTIYNEKGEAVFTQVTQNTAGFIQPVSMKEMQPGQYTIEVTGGNETVSRKVVYAPAQSIKNVRVAKLRETGKYLLSVPGEGTKEINVSIFDGEKNLVHSEDRIVEGSLGIVYAMEGVSGIPTFEITEKSGLIHPINY